MFGEDIILGWILDGLAARFGPGRVSGWIVLVCSLVLAAAGVAQVAAWEVQ
ncbi:hypothetical protein [Lacipirellula sp.]|uniref:hypothetical protein n=1 Tax=Lacipirellula sp. TaxID=2691419 RepID=UPI003D135A38